MKPSQATVTASDLVIQASLSTAGPYGDDWQLTLAPDRTVFVEVYYGGAASGSVTGSFFLSAEAVSEIANAVETQDFFNLPDEISRQWVVLHNPDFFISVSKGGRSHKVNLYNPEELGPMPEVQRFLAVWDALFRHLPLRPALGSRDWSPNPSLQRTTPGRSPGCCR
jgi:hypothetical protein